MEINFSVFIFYLNSSTAQENLPPYIIYLNGINLASWYAFAK